MAKPHIQELGSAYYPPRQRWYSAIFYLGDAFKRRGLALDRFRKPPEVKLWELVASLLVPGLGIWLRGPRGWGSAALGGSAALAFIFVVWLGYPAANLFFGLLIALHATGFVYYCRPMLAGERLLTRFGFTFTSLLVVGFLFYLPAQNYTQRHFLTPLSMHDRVIVVQRIAQTRNIGRGDWLAYQFDKDMIGDPHGGGAVWVRAGMGLGPVLARPGDRVAFSADSYSVNGDSFPKLPHMPDSGEFTVTANHWFIWPRLDIRGHGNVAEANVALTMLNMASVDKTQFIGKAFHRWFWRKQELA